MTTYVALLRAVNVGSANRIKMADLRAAFVADGYADAVTHIQTGNVIFASKQDEPATKRRVEALITKGFDLSITAIMRTAAELRAVTRSNPLLGETEPTADITKLHVVFLEAVPAAAAVEKFLAAPIGDDVVRVVGREVYVRYAAGAGTTKLTGSVWNRLGVASTARNWNVTRTLADLAGG